MFFSYVVYDTIEIEPVYFPALQPTSRAYDEAHTGTALTTRTTAAVAAATATATTSAEPYELGFGDVLLHRLSEKYVGKVLPRYGLCVAIVAVLEHAASLIKGPNAAAWLAVTFEVCVFAPRPGIRLRARILRQASDGVYLGMDFFLAFPFRVPAAQLVHGTCYDATRQCWYLPLEEEEEEERGGEAGESRAGQGPSVVQRNYYTDGEEVLVRVMRCVVRSSSEVAEHGSVLGKDGSAAAAAALPLMELVGSFDGDGLGPVAWFE